MHNRHSREGGRSIYAVETMAGVGPRFRGDGATANLSHAMSSSGVIELIKLADGGPAPGLPDQFDMSASASRPSMSGTTTSRADSNSIRRFCLSMVMFRHTVSSVRPR